MLCGLEEMARFLREHDNFAVITHFKPDGDAYGSALGLVHLLRGMGKRAFPVCDDPVERKYQFLPGWGEFTNAEKGLPFQPETALGVDVSDASRMGKSEALYRSCPHQAAIDHHASNVGFAPCTLLEAEAASAGEIVVKLSSYMGEKLTKDVAQQLYTAIVTDSGNFIYDCRFDGIDRPYFLEMAIDAIPGVVENGLFLNTAYEVLVCDGKGSVTRMSESVAKTDGQREIRVF